MTGQRTAPHRILCVAGARPNLMKVAPLMRAFDRIETLEAQLVHTGQHYDRAMKDVFFEELDLREPEFFLGIGSGSHASQTGRLLLAIEPVVEQVKPDAVVVVGDVNSTLAAALVATKLHVPVVHVEAGLRSFDRTMPEEINRILTDQISDLLFITEDEAIRNLRQEGIAEDKIHLVGNVMIDSLLHALPRAKSANETFAAHGAAPAFVERATQDGYAFVTLHRPSNVDHHETLKRQLGTLNKVADRIPIVFAVHPRTRKAAETHGLAAMLEHPFILATEPLSYLETVGLVSKAEVVLTDSGGLQEETTGLGVPCLTLRENTERPITVSQGTNIVVGTDPDRILAEVDDVLRTGGKKGRIPALWDGKAAERIAAQIDAWLTARQTVEA